MLERDPRHVPMQVQCPNSPSRGNVRIRLFNGLKRPVEHSKVGRQFNSGIDYRFEVCHSWPLYGQHKHCFAQYRVTMAPPHNDGGLDNRRAFLAGVAAQDCPENGNVKAATVG